MPATPKLKGHRFGRLTVVNKWITDRLGNRMWICRCDCGNTVVSATKSLKNGYKQSCGCLQRQRSSEKNSTHRLRFTAEYLAWASMKQRCCNPNNKAYRYYGGRGIAICERWLNSFADFYKDMGARPSPGLSLERIDNDAGYSPSNCRWATRKEQNQNKRNVRKKGQNNE